MPRSYTPQEMEEILRRAMQREARGEITHEEMVEAAQEVGIDAQAVEEAAHELEAERSIKEQQARVRSELRRRALGSVGNYLVINAIAFAVDAFTGPGQWFQWVLLGTTALLLRRLFVSLFPGDRELERAHKRMVRREERSLRHRDRARWQELRQQRKKQTSEHLERAVEEGVQALLKVAADKLEQYNRAGEPPRPAVRVEAHPADPGDPAEDAEILGDEPRNRRPR